MVRWYHVIFSAYGFWLPNDPRGSWSEFVHSWELFRFGGSATKVTAKRSYAHDPHDVIFRRGMKEHLKYPLARFDEACRESIGRGFARACEEFGFRFHACAIGFDHVHIVSARDEERDIEGIVAVLKARATTQMKKDGTHPMRAYDSVPTAWAKSCWSVFINDEQQLANAIDYVERHPDKEGLARQKWRFVTPYRSV
ncbi:MAG TPA: transposase [Tepidisphaeraceae bacterium]|nr:transposase [Tepidisphaeraceae bacterium]